MAQSRQAGMGDSLLTDGHKGYKQALCKTAYSIVMKLAVTTRYRTRGHIHHQERMLCVVAVGLCVPYSTVWALTMP
jgi:hypothetical protein